MMDSSEGETQLPVETEDAPAASPEADHMLLTDDEPAQGKRKLRGKVPFMVGGLFLVGAIAVGAAFYVIQQVRSSTSVLSFVPEKADYYLRIRIGDDDPQVNQGEALAERFPGGADFVEVIGSAIELFGQPLDPFQDVLTLAEDEIFLAKVRQADEEDRRRFRRAGLVDELVNIVGLSSAQEAQNALVDISGRSGRTTEERNAFGLSYRHITLDELDEEETVVTLDPLPHRVTIPYSLETYLINHDRFLISGDAEEDIQEVAKLLSGSGEGESPLRPITDHASHKEVTGHFSDGSLLQFYQQQELVPQFGIFPWEIFGGFLVDADLPAPSTNRLAAGLLDVTSPVAFGQETSTTVGRGVTVDMNDAGAVLSIFSEIQDTRQFVNTFSADDSNAMRIPETLGGRAPMLHVETANLWDKVRGFREVLEDGSANAQDEETRTNYQRALASLEEALAELSEIWGVDFERDILSWMSGNASATLAAGFGGEAPTYAMVFSIDDSDAASAGIGQIAITDSRAQSGVRRVTREIDTLARHIGDFFEANGRDPLDLNELSAFIVDTRMARYGDYYDEAYLSNLRESQEEYVADMLVDDSGNTYGYRAVDGGAGYVLEGTLPDGRTYRWSFIPGQTPEEGIMEGEADAEYGTLRPTAETIEGAQAAYRLRFASATDTGEEGSQFLEVYIAITDDRVVISESKETVEVILNDQGATFGESEGFRAQFAGAPDEIAGLYYTEPYGYWGIAEYVMTLFTGESLDELYAELEEDPEAKDTLVAAEAYLKTLKDIGGYFALEGRTVVVPTLFRIVELPEAEKNRAEVAVDRLLRAEEGEDIYFNGTARQRGRDAKRLADLDAMRLALEVYADQNNSVYPDAPSAPGTGPSPEIFNELADALVEAQLLSARPVDPAADSSYVAQTNSATNATSYILGTDLESDQAACDSDYDGTDLDGAGALCGETTPGQCGGSEPDGVDYCICQGRACK